MGNSVNINNNTLSGGVSEVRFNKFDEMDPETRLMVVCYGMLSLLDDRMKGQMDVLQAKNQRASQLKAVVSQLNDVLAKFDAKAVSEDTISSNSKDEDKNTAINSLASTLEDLGIPEVSSLLKKNQDGVIKIKKSDLEFAVSKVTGMMDSNTTVQQLEMFTLQSVFSKRNENFELMSTSLKKSQDTKSALIRNF